MNELWQAARGLVAGLFIASLTACATQGSSSAPDYYLLEAPQLDAWAQQATSLRLAVGPVVVPDYLDQPALVVRHEGYELRLAEHERWATPLAQQIPSVLRSSFEQLLPGLETQGFPSALGGAYDYRVAIEVQRFDGAPAARLELTANWQLSSGNGDILPGGVGSVRLSRVVSGTSMLGLVAAQAAVLGELAQQIVPALVDLRAER